MTDRLVATSAALADEVIARELPGVRADDRAAAVRLVADAIGSLPDSVRPGVAVAGTAVRVRRRWAGPRWADADLPVLRDYVRLVRGLALAAACEVTDRDGAGDGGGVPR
jgi:hypothetical protein